MQSIGLFFKPLLLLVLKWCVLELPVIPQVKLIDKLREYSKNSQLKAKFGIFYFYIFKFSVLLLSYKDVSLFLKFYINTISYYNFNSHKRFLVYMQKFLNFILELGQELGLLYGYSFSVGGKITIGGASRPRFVEFKQGKTSRTLKNIRVEKQVFTFISRSGACGGSLTLFY